MCTTIVIIFILSMACFSYMKENANMFKRKYRIVTTYDGKYKIQDRFIFCWSNTYISEIASFEKAKELLVELIKENEFKPVVTNVTIKNNPEVIFEEENHA